jgi:hypothetical protein
MPIHDWSRVSAGIFHDFHNAWITHLRAVLNERVLPTNYYALAEQVSTAGDPDTPQVALVEELNGVVQLDNIAVRLATDDRVVAMIEILSPGKGAQYPFDRFLSKTAGWLASGYHLLLIDLHPRTPRDPHGIHVALWSELGGSSQQAANTKPLTLASYRSAEPPQAFVEPISVGDPLNSMPIFLDGDQYVLAPLEDSYQAALAFKT